MSSGESRDLYRVNTLPVALLGFSLISTLILAYLTAYCIMYSMVDYPPDVLSQFSPKDVWVIHSLKTFLIFLFILPLITSLVVWYVTPLFIRKWLALTPLPFQYQHVHSLVQETASKMGISPPFLFFTTKNIANCFNLGKREGESAIVISKWLITHLDSEELKSILAHEMAHKKNRDVTLMAYFAAARRIIFATPFFVFLGTLYILLPAGVPVSYILLSPHFWTLIFVLFFVFFPLALGIQWFSRLREGAADARASLAAGKDVLKRTLYKIAAAKSTQLWVVSSCLMVFSNKKCGSILSTHPSLHKRFDMLEKDTFLIDVRRPPSLRSCLTYAASILLCIQLAGFAWSMPLSFLTGHLLHGTPLLIFHVLFVAGLFNLYDEYDSLKYTGIIILFVSILRIIMSLLIVIPSSFIVREIVVPAIGSIETIPSFELRVLLSYAAAVGFDIPETIVSTVKGVIIFAFFAFLAAVSLKYIRRYTKSYLKSR
jgi:Zn-dependent protease with chaperone function